MRTRSILDRGLTFRLAADGLLQTSCDPQVTPLRVTEDGKVELAAPRQQEQR